MCSRRNEHRRGQIVYMMDLIRLGSRIGYKLMGCEIVILTDFTRLHAQRNEI
jgi:hypothetical protein